MGIQGHMVRKTCRDVQLYMGAYMTVGHGGI